MNDRLSSNARPNVLIAHTSLLEAKRVAQWLEAQGFQTFPIGASEAAIEEALSGHYAAVVLAITSPQDIEGASLLRQAGFLRPLIGLSATALPEHDHVYFDCLLPLPLDEALLLKLLRDNLLLPNAEQPQPVFENSPLFLQLRDSFLLSLTVSMQEIEEAFAAKNWTHSSHLAHALKGTAASFGFMELAHSCMQIEILLRAGDNLAASAELDPLRRQTHALLL